MVNSKTNKMAYEEKIKAGNINTVSTAKGSFEKFSLELGNIGNVIEKNGKVYLEFDADAPGLNKYEKDGKVRWFFNMTINTYKAVNVDTWKPNADFGGGQAQGGGGSKKDDLPF